MRENGKKQQETEKKPRLLSFANLNAAPEFHAHFGEYVDFGLYYVLFQAEVGYAVHHHSAGACGLVKYRGLVALGGKEICAGHTRGTGTDDGKTVVGVIGLIVLSVKNICDKLLVN